jgi:hypothetical protein
MAQRTKRLEQQLPTGDSPAKTEKYRKGKSSTYPGKFKPGRDLPKGVIKQNRARPGRTSQQ